MSWLVLANKGLRIADDAAAMAALVHQIRAGVQQGGDDHRAVLRALADGRFVEQLDGEALRESVAELAGIYLSDPWARSIKTLLERLHEVVAGQDDPVRVLWPKAEWSTVADRDAFRLELGAAAHASFLLQPNDPAEKPDHVASDGVAARLAFDGRTRLGGEVDAGAAGQSVAASGTAWFARQLSCELAYERDAVTGQVLHDALSRVGRPDDFDAVVAAFRRPPVDVIATGAVGRPLREIRMSGDKGLLLDGKVKVTPRLGTGAAEIEVNGKVELANSHELRVRIADESRDGDSLRVTATVNTGKNTEGGLRIAYRLGLSDLSPETARDLLETIGDWESRLADWGDDADAIMEELRGLDAWLKPGTALAEALENRLAEELNARGSTARTLKKALALAVGLGVEDNRDEIVARVRNVLSGKIDNVDGLFTGDTESILKNLFEETIEDGDEQVRNKLDEIAADLGAQLKAELDSLAEKMDDRVEEKLDEFLVKPVVDKVGKVKRYLDDARGKLGEVLERLGESGADVVAAEIAWHKSVKHARDIGWTVRINEDGKDFYRKLVRSPVTLAARAIDEDIPGVEPEQFDVLGKSSLREGREWNIGLLDTLDFGGKRLALAEISVRKTQSGVAVGSEQSLEQRRDAFFSADGSHRRIIFADRVDFSRTDSMAPSDAGKRLNGELALTLVQYEPQWERGSEGAREFAEAFARAGVIGPAAVREFVAVRDHAAAAGGGRKSAPEATAAVSIRIAPSASNRIIELVRNDRACAREIVRSARTFMEGSGPQAANFDHEINNVLNAFDLLGKAREALGEIAVAPDAARRKALRERALEHQDEAMDRLDGYWTTPGLVPEFIEPRPAALAFFRALQHLCLEAAHVRPAVEFTFRVEDDPVPRRVIADPAEAPPLEIVEMVMDHRP